MTERNFARSSSIGLSGTLGAYRPIDVKMSPPLREVNVELIVDSTSNIYKERLTVECMLEIVRTSWSTKYKINLRI